MLYSLLIYMKIVYNSDKFTKIAKFCVVVIVRNVYNLSV